MHTRSTLLAGAMLAVLAAGVGGQVPAPKRLPPGAANTLEAARRMQQRMLDLQKRLMDQLEDAVENGGVPFEALPPGLGLPGGGRVRPAPVEPRLGAELVTPGEALADQLDLPKGHGLVVQGLMKDGTAAKAGLKRHDVLLELGGWPVLDDVGAFRKQLDIVKAGEKVDAVVMRKGRKETLKGLVLSEAKAEAPPARPNPFGVLGGVLRPGVGVPRKFSIQRRGDEFTAREAVSGGVELVVRGKVEDGKAKVAEVRVTRDGKEETFDSIIKAPDEFKARARELADMAARGPGSPRGVER